VSRLENLPCSKNALTLVLDGGVKTVISIDRPPRSMRHFFGGS